MAKSSKKIVQDLLREANYYWHDENADNVKPLNPEDYDPVVDKIFKANAVELEKLYSEIEESQNEIILNLSKSLVPDLSLLPEPGYTVAQIRPKASRIYTTQEDHYKITGQSDTGEQFEYYFTPLYDHEFPACEIVAILTDHAAMQVTDNKPEVISEIHKGKAISNIWLGLDISKVKENDRISFFLGNRIVDEFDKDYHLFNQAKWILHGETEIELDVSIGIEGFAEKKSHENLLDALDIPHSHEKQIHSRLKKSFIHVSLPDDLNFHKREFPPNFPEKELISKLDINDALCWVKLELPLAIPSDFLIRNKLYPNCIPLINRRIIERQVVKTSYDRILLSMPTTDYFLDVHKIQDAKNREEGSSYQKVDFLHPDASAGTYMLRSGSRVRRFNRNDASRRIHRLLEVIHDEYSTFKEEGVNRLKEDFDTIEKAINRIKGQMPDYFRNEESRTSYFCVANFRPRANRLYYQYWETQGDQIRHLGNKTELEVSSNDVKISGSQSIIPIQHGKGELSPDDYINQLKISLLSRGRILTKGDIELYTKSRFGNVAEVSSIDHKIMMLEDGKRGRGILVEIIPLRTLSKNEAELIRLELQNDLNAKSAFFTSIKVEMNNG